MVARLAVARGIVVVVFLWAGLLVPVAILMWGLVVIHIHMLRRARSWPMMMVAGRQREGGNDDGDDEFGVHNVCYDSVTITVSQAKKYHRAKISVHAPEGG